jgi:hypothetical protein
MEQSEFLKKKVFNEFSNQNSGSDKETIHHFSESDFEKILEKVEHFGIGIYTIESFLHAKSFAIAKHEEYKKKATDSRWYKKAFSTFKHRQTGLTFCATYKVSAKLLAR